MQTIQDMPAGSTHTLNVENQNCSEAVIQLADSSHHIIHVTPASCVSSQFNFSLPGTVAKGIMNLSMICDREAPMCYSFNISQAPRNASPYQNYTLEQICDGANKATPSAGNVLPSTTGTVNTPGAQSSQEGKLPASAASDNSAGDSSAGPSVAPDSSSGGDGTLGRSSPQNPTAQGVQASHPGQSTPSSPSGSTDPSVESPDSSSESPNTSPQPPQPSPITSPQSPNSAPQSPASSSQSQNPSPQSPASSPKSSIPSVQSSCNAHS